MANWVSAGCGAIANELAQAMEKRGQKLYGVVNRTQEKAEAFAEKYGVKKGDTLQLQDEYSGKKYRFRVKETVAYAAGLSVFMDMEKVRYMADFLRWH